MTDDGQLVHRINHPKSAIWKVRKCWQWHGYTLLCSQDAQFAHLLQLLVTLY
jgi:hypothetical protein